MPCDIKSLEWSLSWILAWLCDIDHIEYTVSRVCLYSFWHGYMAMTITNIKYATLSRSLGRIIIGMFIILGTLSNEDGDGNGDFKTRKKTGVRTPLWREGITKRSS